MLKEREIQFDVSEFPEIRTKSALRAVETVIVSVDTVSEVGGGLATLPCVGGESRRGFPRWC